MYNISKKNLSLAWIHNFFFVSNKFNAKLHRQAKTFNTQVAEQTISWFSRFKHIGRHMARASYWVFILGLFHERNKITKARHKAKRDRPKRKIGLIST